MNDNESDQPQHSAVMPKALLLIGCLLMSVLAGRMLRGGGQDDSDEVAGTSVSSSNEANSTVGGSTHPAKLSHTELTYLQYCAKCHGDQGHGDGDGIPSLAIRPRDFRTTKWRFVKTSESVERVIRDGIPGTPMPSLKLALSSTDIAALSEFVLSLGVTDESFVDEDLPLVTAGFTPVVPATIPSVRLVSNRGESVRLTEVVKGPAIIHFWGTSCHHCVADMPDLDRLAVEFTRKGLSIINICGDESDAEAIKSFSDSYQNLNFYADASGLAMSRFSAAMLPTFFVVDSSGQVVGVANKAPSLQASAALLDALR